MNLQNLDADAKNISFCRLRAQCFDRKGNAGLLAIRKIMPANRQNERIHLLLMFTGTRLGILAQGVRVMHLAQELTDFTAGNVDLAYNLGRGRDLFERRPANIRKQQNREVFPGTRTRRREAEYEAVAFLTAARQIFVELALNLDDLIDPAFANVIESWPNVPVNERLCEAFKQELQSLLVGDDPSSAVGGVVVGPTQL